VGGFLVFSVCGVWFNLQNLHFIPRYFVAFFVYVEATRRRQYPAGVLYRTLKIFYHLGVC
jgi:hypothetical protein